MVKLLLGAGGWARNGGRSLYVTNAPEYWLVLVMTRGPCVTRVPVPLVTTVMEKLVVTTELSAESVTFTVTRLDPARVGLPTIANPLVVTNLRPLGKFEFVVVIEYVRREACR